MALSAELEAEFGDGGFNLTATLDVSAADLSEIVVEPSGIDLGALDGVIEAVGGLGTDGIAGTVGDLLELATTALSQIPAVDDALAPLLSVLDLAGSITGSAGTDALAAISGASTPDGLAGLPALDVRLAGIGAIRDDPSVQNLLDLAGNVVSSDVDLDATIGDVSTWLSAIRELVTLLGGLMSVESASLDLRRLTEMASEMLVPSELSAALADVTRFEGSSLDDLLVGIDPDDAELVELLVGPFSDYSVAINRLAWVVRSGMAFGEATLAQADVSGLATRIGTASAALREDGISSIRAATEQLAAWLEPVLRIDLPDQQTDLNAFADAVMAVVADLAGAVDRLDPAVLAGPVTAGFDRALSVFDDIAAAAEQVRTLLAASLGTVRALIETIDLAPLVDAVRAALAPIAEALETVEQLVSGAQAGIETVSDDAILALEGVKSSLGAASSAVAEAFGRLDVMVTAIGLDTLQATLDELVRPVAEFVGSADLSPYFDDANAAIGTAADVIDAVPFEILPDDVLSDVAEAIEPVKQIDFQTDIADVLKARMAEIGDALDTDVLTAIEGAYAEVVEFLDSIDPSVALEAFEAEVFDPLIAAVRSVDLEAVLTPLEEALAPIREAIDGFDPVSDLLAPVEGLIADAAQHVAAFDPGALLAPVEAEVDAVRDAVTDALLIDEWGGWLDVAEETVRGAVANIDMTRVATLLDAAHDSLVDEVRGGEGGPSVVGTVIAALLESSGLGIRASSFGTVSAWIAGADGATEISDGLAAAAAAVDAQLAAVEAVDVQGLIARLAPMHRAITAGLAVHAETSYLRARLDVDIAAASPQELLGPLAANQAAYVVALRDNAVALRRLAASGRSEIAAVSQALREALRPLQPVIDRLRALLTRFGLDPSGMSPRDVAVELLTTFRPSRLLKPLTSAVDVLRVKLESLAVDGLIGPVREAVATVEATLDAVDIGFIRTELTATHAEIVGLIEALSPTAILGDVLTEFENVRTALLQFDPLGPVREVVEAMTAIIDEVDSDFRPTVLFAPVTELYQRLVEALGALDIGSLLRPVLDGLDDIEIQLGDGLDGTAQALSQLQDALPDAGDLGGASVGVSLSVGVG